MTNDQHAGYIVTILEENESAEFTIKDIAYAFGVQDGASGLITAADVLADCFVTCPRIGETVAFPTFEDSEDGVKLTGAGMFIVVNVMHVPYSFPAETGVSGMAQFTHVKLMPLVTPKQSNEIHDDAE